MGLAAYVVVDIFTGGSAATDSTWVADGIVVDINTGGA